MNKMNGLMVSFAVALATTSCTDEATRAAQGTKPEPTSEAPLAAAPARGDLAVKRFTVPVDGLPSYGPRDARVTIVEATDYDCPYCARAENTMATLREKHPRDVRVVVLPVPLPMHPHAETAARASLAVFEAKPEAFVTMHTKLFADQRARTDDDLLAFAEGAGVSSRSYTTALASAGTKDALARSAKLASALHVNGTPTFFVNGRIVRGAQTLATFETIVDEEITHTHDLEAAGVPRVALYEAILKEARENPAPLEKDPEETTVVREARGVGGAHFLGSPSAKTTLTLFTDLACPYCARLDTRLRELSEKHPEVKVVLRHAPLPMHENAPLAARAAIAADAQGKLAPFVAQVFTNQHTQDRAVLEEHARKAGLDMARFTKDLDAPWTAARLEEDRALARKLGVEGTPTTFVEDERVVGAQPLALFERALTSAKARAAN